MKSTHPTQIFSVKLLDSGKGKIKVHPNMQCIKLLDDFCTVMYLKNEELVKNVFSDILNNYLNYNWFNNRVILIAKNMDVNEINNQIQHLYRQSHDFSISRHYCW